MGQDDGPPAVVLGDLTLTRPLSWAGVPVIAVTADPRDPTLRSRQLRGACVVPGFGAAHEEATVRRLEALGRRLQLVHRARPPLFYGSDRHLDLLARHRARLAECFRFLLNEPRLARDLLDKAAFSRRCEECGVRSPRTVAPGRPPGELASLRPPLVVKPMIKIDWKEIRALLFDGAHGKAQAFASAAELLAHPGFAAVRDRVIVQEYVDAATGDLVSFHGFADQDGRILASFCGRKVRTYPRVAGESALVELLDEPALACVGADVVRRLGLRGPFKIDFARHRQSGELYTLEVNARYTLWNHLGAACGVNLPAVAYDWLVHRRTPADAPASPRRARRPGHRPVRWVSLGRDFRGLLREDGGASGWARWARSLAATPLIHEVFDWEDPVPAVYLLGQLGRAAAAKVWR